MPGRTQKRLDRQKVSGQLLSRPTKAAPLVGSAVQVLSPFLPKTPACQAVPPGTTKAEPTHAETRTLFARNKNILSASPQCTLLVRGKKGGGKEPRFENEW